MNERIDRDGITIPDEVAEAAGLPDDLDATIGEQYRFPSPQRRSQAARIYAVGAVLAVVSTFLGLPRGMWWVAVGFTLLAGFHVLAAWRPALDEKQAFSSAAGAVDFSVGHGSAALRFEGLLAKPVWNVLLYDAGRAPTRRALVRVDAVNGDVIDAIAEEFSVPSSDA